MTDVTVKNVQMTYLNQSAPSKNHSKLGRAALRNGSNNDVEIVAKFAMPGGFAVYSSAKFRIYASQAIPSRTYTLKLLTGKFDFGKVKWSNRPGASGTGAVSVTKAVAKNGFIEFDVTALLNEASKAGVFYGFRIEMTSGDNTVRYFYTSKSSTKYGPSLTARYTTAPRKPTALNPSNDRFISTAKPIMTSEFLDRAGSTLLSAVRVQIHSTTNFTTPDFDSQWFDSAVPQIDLNNFAYSIDNKNVDYHWRINHRDGDGNESGWSDIATFRRTDPVATPTILSPADAPDNVVEDATPTILWSSVAQKDFQILLWDAFKTAVLATTGKLSGTAQDYEIPVAAFTKGVSLMQNVDYIVELRIWDSVLRTTLSNDPAFASVEKTFRYVPSVTVTPTTDLSVVQVGVTPWGKMTWKRTSAPDEFDIFRDGVMIRQGISPEDVFVSGTTYSWTDKTASPRTEHTWEVKARQNGRQSGGNAKVTKEIVTPTAFLAFDDSDVIIPFLNYDADISRRDGSYVVNVINSDEAITVYQGQATRQGEFVGLISGEIAHPSGPRTSRQYKNELYELDDDENRGRVCFLSWADELIAVAVSKIDDRATVYNEEVCYMASFYVTERTKAVQT